MIDWKAVLENAFTQNFQNVCTRFGRERYIDREVKKAQIHTPSLLSIKIPGTPKHSVAKAETQCQSEADVDVFEWEQKAQRIGVYILKEGDFVGIIDTGTTMLYVANIGCHPYVVTDEIVFLNSDGSTLLEFPKELLKQSGNVVAEFLIKTARKFIEEQIH